MKGGDLASCAVHAAGKAVLLRLTPADGVHSHGVLCLAVIFCPIASARPAGYADFQGSAAKKALSIICFFSSGTPMARPSP